VVADISHRSPSVMYELAFAHALGIPTVLIDSQDAQPAKKDVFYLRQDRTLRPASGSPEDLRAELEPFMREWLEGKSDLTSNPLVRFYKLPLVDISAVAGIALGYAENFIVPLMTAIQDAKEQTHDGKRLATPTAVVVVLPDSLDHFSEQEQLVRKELEREFGGNGVLCQRLAAATSYGPRTVPFYVAGAFVDIPRTLIPLRRSRRVKRLRDQDNPEWEIMERKLVAAFRRNLQREAETSSNISAKRLHIVGLPDNRLDIEGLPELTPTLKRLQSE
jgi:Prokaryotic STING domain